MASSVPTATSVATSTPESIVCTVNPQAVNAIFLQGTAFPGIEIPRQHITNFVQSMPSVSVHQQQPQQQQVQLISTLANASTSGVTIKGQHDSIVTVVGSGGKQTKQGRQNQQNQIVHQSSSQLTGPLMTAIAFPGNPIQSHSVQQHVSIPQNSHQQITVVPTTTNNRSGIWPCPACKITFKSATELQAHLTAHTKVEKSVPCGTCGKLFASAERVRIHIRVAHGEKSCACEICGSGFSYRCKLLDHMRTHTGDKPFRCEVCSRSFSQKNHLRRHQMIHTGERPYPCEICGRGFYRKDKLSRHRKIHLTNQEKAAQSSVKSEKHSRHHNSNSNANNASATQQQATQQSNLGNVVASSSQPTIIIPIVPQFANRQGAPQWVAQVGQQIVSTSMASGVNVNSSTNNVTANNNDRTNSHHSPSGSPSAMTGDV